jgi:hypothetical protein
VTLTIVTANVGAGYTGVLAGRGQTALIDCGGADEGAAAVDALSRLTERHCWPWWWNLRSPGKEPLPFDAFVLSHPHLDHYNGLVALANNANPAMPPLLKADARFYHPRLPSDPVAAEATIRMVALDCVFSGIPDFAIAQAVDACAGTHVPNEPLSQGDSLELAGECFDVLWPPEHLPSGAIAKLRRLIKLYDEFAREAEDKGDLTLKHQLDRLREGDHPDYASDHPRDADHASGLEAAIYARAGKRQHDDRPSPEHRQPVPLSAPPISHVEHPDYVERLKELRTAFTNGGNLLSLVLASKGACRYVFLGDLDKSLHGRVTPSLIDHKPELVSSAHHGTHFSPKLKGLRSRYVVSSVGKPLTSKVKPGYSAMGMHLRTDEAGDIGVRIDPPFTYMWARAAGP